jgi:2-methylfumaryl-CoA isomerase
LAATSVVYERYRTFAQMASDPRVVENPMFQHVDQPRIGAYLAPTTPMSIDGGYPVAKPAPANGDDSAHVLSSVLGLSDSRIADLHNRGVIRAVTPPHREDPA